MSDAGSGLRHSSPARAATSLGRACVAGGRALRVKPVGLIAVGIPAANSLSRIFVRIGYRAKPRVLTVCETISIRLPYTIPDSMPGSLDCKARGLQPPGYFRRHLLLTQ